MASTQLCTFVVDGLHFGVEVLGVQEVIRSLEMTRVPLADPSVAGLINLRGQIVTAIDLRTRLALPPRPADRDPMNVIVRTEDGAISLLVDEIGDVTDADEDLHERPPATLPAAAQGMVRGVFKLPGRLLLHLDVSRATRLGAAA